MSQPSISIQIQGLEQELGVKLFDRSNKGVSLTKAGWIYYQHACKALQTMRDARETIFELNKDKRGYIHLGATLTIGEYILPHIVGYLSQNADDIDFSVKIANTKIVAQDILERQLHIALVEGPVPIRKELVVESFWHDELALIVPANHPWAKRSSITYSELIAERVITREQGSGTREVMELALSRGGFDPAKLNIVAELGSTQAIKQAVMDGLGVTIISALTVQQECKLSLLKTLRVQGCQLTRPLSILTHAKAAPTKEEQLFVDFLRDEQSLEAILSPTQRMCNPLCVERDLENGHPYAAYDRRCLQCALPALSENESR